MNNSRLDNTDLHAVSSRKIELVKVYCEAVFLTNVEYNIHIKNDWCQQLSDDGFDGCSQAVYIHAYTGGTRCVLIGRSHLWSLDEVNDEDRYKDLPERMVEAAFTNLKSDARRLKTRLKKACK